MSSQTGWKSRLSRLLLIDLLKGLALTFKYNYRALANRRRGGDPNSPIYTECYPEERPRVAERFRGAPRLNNHPETGETLCIACNLCALACPESCIYVGAVQRQYTDAGKTKRKKVLTTFIYDTSRCMFCDLCVEACPTACLELTQEFELATYSRAGLVWDREMLEKGRDIAR